MAGKAKRRIYSQRDSGGGSTDLTPWRILKLINQGVAPDRGRSLMSTIALFFVAGADPGFWRGFFPSAVQNQNFSSSLAGLDTKPPEVGDLQITIQ